MDDTLQNVASMLPWLSAAVAVLGGLWALRRIRRVPVVDRAERAIAVGLALALAVLAPLGVIGMIPMSNPAGGSIGLFLVLGILLAVAGFVFLSAIFGYVVLARPRLGAIALAGVIVGPLLLGGTMALGLKVNQDAASAAQADAFATGQAALEIQLREAARQLAERSGVLHVSVRDVTVSTAPFHDAATGIDRTVIGKVRLTLVLRADAPIHVRTDPGWAPEVWLYPADDPVKAGLFAALPVGSPDVVAAAETPFALEFGYTADELAGRITYPPGVPGTWTLRVRINPVDSLYLQVETPLVLAAG
jgi:hypothetical protein